MTLAPQSASVKAGILAAIAIVLLIPLGLLLGIVNDRTRQRDAAVQSVARGWGEKQWTSGPLLAIPVTRQESAKESATRTLDWYVLADNLEISADLKVQDSRRRLGLYEVPVYIAHIRATGSFALAHEIERLTAGGDSLRLHLDQARLLLPVADPRGLRALVSASGGLKFEPSTGFPLPVLSAPLNLAVHPEAPVNFDLWFDLAGTQALEFLPLARVAHVQTRGNWPDPGFTDGFLPVERGVDSHGFTASWQVLNINRSYGDRWFQGATPDQTLLGSAFGVELVQPVDIYQRCTRAVKYGGLFVALSFLTLFLVETLRRSPLHPIQYGLMGLALSVFYLLLLALAEQVGFLLAYLLAATAVCLLMGTYLASAFGSARAGLASGTAFAATYALLYLLVTSENYALLAGSLALFALLATAMLLTRKHDWSVQSTRLKALP